MSLTWSGVASVFANPMTRLGAMSYPIAGFAIVQFLSDNEALGPGRLCKVLNCQVIESKILKGIIFLDQYSLPFIYYSVLLFSISYYLYLVFCWPPIKKYISLVGILNAYQGLDGAAAKMALAELVSPEDLTRNTTVPTLLSQIYKEKNSNWTAVFASLLMITSIVLIIASSILQISVTTIFLAVVELGLLQDLSINEP